jgi:polyphosphate glucokinase
MVVKRIHSNRQSRRQPCSTKFPAWTNQQTPRADDHQNDVRDEKDTIMNVLAIDIGGTHVKVLATGQKQKREFDSGPTLTARKMVSKVRKLVADWDYDVVSIGYPGLVSQNRPVSDPWNLGKGWAGFKFEAAFRRPVKVANDAAMQALGSYKGGKMLFLGLGTGLGSTLIVDGIVEPMELGHLPYRKATFEDYVGVQGLKRYGRQKWRHYVADVVRRLVAALEPEDVVLGGGNVPKLKKLPPGCRAGDNANAFLGGFRLWQDGGLGRSFARLGPAEGGTTNRVKENQRKRKTRRS